MDKLRLAKDRAVVRLVGSIDDGSVGELLDHVDLARDAYGLRRIEIQVDSPGGDVKALRYCLRELDRRRGPERLSFTTTALAKAYSAAAVLVALGGDRREARPGATFLLHPARTPVPEDRAVTAETAAAIGAELAEVDWAIRRRLVRRLMRARPSGEPAEGAAGRLTAGDLRALRRMLPAQASSAESNRRPPELAADGGDSHDSQAPPPGRHPPRAARGLVPRRLRRISHGPPLKAMCTALR